MSDQLDRVLSALEAATGKPRKPNGSGGLSLTCPAHADSTPSLSVASGADGRVLLKCLAGCDTSRVLSAAGLTFSDLSPSAPAGGNGSQSKRRIVATYSYTDETGALLFEVVRFDPKDFRQRRPDGKGGWQWSLDGVRRVLFRLPEILAAIARGETIFITEGEKDAKALVLWGLCATTNAGGAGKWRPEYAEALRGARVVILPDNDRPGRDHAQAVAKALHGVASEVRVVELPGLPPKGDVSDWIAAGGTRDALEKIVSETPVFDPNAVEADTQKPDSKTLSAFDEKGHVIPLCVARMIHRKRPHLVFVQGDCFDYKDGIFGTVDPAQIDVGAISLIDDSARRAVLGDVRHLLGVETYQRADFFDCAPSDVLMVANGALDFATRELRPHAPEYRARNVLSVTYDATVDCPRFKQFLLEVLPDDPDARQVLIEFMGYCLTRDTSQEKMLLLIGEGANGKGVYTRVLTRLVGAHNATAIPLPALRSDRTFPTAALVGKLLNIAPESELAGAQIDEGWLKSLISGDRLEVERKGRDPFSFLPTAKFIVQSNNPSHITDKSHGFWRRLLPIRFPRVFSEAEQDRDLSDKLAQELPGILNMALDGLASLAARGRFFMSTGMASELSAYRAECNPLSTWIEERLGAVPADLAGMPARVSGAAAYDDYRTWCKDNGHSPYSRAKFGRECRRLGMIEEIYREGQSTVRGFSGVQLRKAVETPWGG